MGNILKNVFDLPEHVRSGARLNNEITEVIAVGGGARIERIISTGQVSDWYNQDESEFVALLEGAAKIEYENGESVALSRGDTLIIKPHERHRVSYTSANPPCIWLCVFYN